MSLLPRAAVNADSTTLDPSVLRTGTGAGGLHPWLSRTRRLATPLAAALALTLAVGLVLQLAHAGQHEGHELPPVLHWLRDSLMAFPAALAALCAVGPAGTRAARRLRRRDGSTFALSAGALAGSLLFAVASVPGSIAHSALFDAHHEGMGFVQHALFESQIVLASAFGTLMALGLAGALRGPATWQKVRIDGGGRAGATAAGARWWLAAGAVVALADILYLRHVSDGAPLSRLIADALPAVPLATLTTWAITRPVPLARVARSGAVTSRVQWAAAGATLFALTSVPGSLLDGGYALGDTARAAAATLPVGFAGLMAATVALGAPWELRRGACAVLAQAVRSALSRPRVLALVRVDLLGAGAAAVLLVAAGVVSGAMGGSANAAALTCGALPGTRTLTADVVALDQKLTYNRLGVTAPGGMMYALRRDVVVADPGSPNNGKPLTAQGVVAEAGKVALRPDKRPRPLTLRMNVGDCLQINFQNLLHPTRVDDNQPADRHVGVHVKGLLLVDPDGAGPAKAIDSDGSNVGANASSLAAPGQSRSYRLYGEHENTYLMENLGVTAGSEAVGGTTAFGLFGAVNVEPFKADWYRSQVTRVDMDLAAAAWTGNDTDGWTPVDQPQVDGAGKLKIRLTPDGQPVVNYAARYPTDSATPNYDAARAGRPILNMLDGTDIAHSDINGVISGPAEDGYRLPKRDYPKSYWNNEIYNLGDDRGQEPFREFTVIFHDEIKAVQAFPEFDDPKFQKTLAGVKDGFAINYGTGGIGAEILANRKGVGPMWDCTDCKYEEFFLTSWAVGDPAMIVDAPANKTKKDAAGNFVPGTRATKAFFPDDPSNVHHSYMNDRVKFRNLHAGPKEHHIFHLHTHQWQMNPNTEKSAYLDSQMIGPGAGYTYEIAYGGSGNRNKTVGDAIFHCHFYPHFAQGMWEMWRTHDTLERGTLLDADGVPKAGSRALPDGEITAGTPIPAVVPLPNRPMAPVPDAATTVVPYDLTGDHTDAPNSSQTDADGDGVADVAQGFENAPKTNAGFPFFVPGVAGHRPPSPPMDMVDVNNDGQVEDGGLARHMIVGGTATHYETPLDFGKILNTAKVAYVPEGGTPTEKKAMDFHAELWHPTFFSNASATPLNGAHPATARNGRPVKGFETNGLPAVSGAPFAEPCRSDPDPRTGDVSKVPVNRTYKGTALQLDVTMNKAAWHFPQERMLALNQDVGDTLAGKRAPEPLVMRLDVNDCANYEHTNLIPNNYQLDDFQVRTPTDIVGQHIHLVKFDVTSADGSANGFNYEDGTLSPQEVTERIDAVRKDKGCAGDGRLDPGDTATKDCPLAVKHPYFGGVAGVGELAWGARTTMQRWFADPVMNHAWDRSLGSVFTHDHFGPSTHQQTGLYATVLAEPEGSQWTDSESGNRLGTRDDGGPTSWRADIKWPAGDSRNDNAHREFYFELADFQHAYQAGGGKLHTQDNGAGVQIPSYADFKNAINPSRRQEPPSGHEADLYWHPPTCANGQPRPCPEAISADDVGTYVLNYRNEPLGLRVFDPVAKKQAAAGAGDLALAFQSRTDRAIPALNTQPAIYPPLTADVAPGDPWTPMMRAYQGDKIQIRSQVGAHEEEHTLMVHGVKWRQEALNPNSGWRNSQGAGISEYFQFQAPVLPNAGAGTPSKEDYLYTMGASTDDLWNGIWGLLRSYRKQRTDLKALPNNTIPADGWTVTNLADFDGFCPKSSVPAKPTVVRAVRAADVLNADGKPRQPGDGAGRLVYNSRGTTVRDQSGKVHGSGPLVDPTALMYVLEGDVIFDNGDPKTGKPVGLKPGTPVEPLVLRARAGDCVKLELWNDLPASVPDQPGYNALPPVVHKDEAVNGGILSFNANDLTPSSMVGMHPQLLQYDVRSDDGLDVGGNSPKLIPPGTKKAYTWYAGDVQAVPDGASSVKFVARPVEFGATNLMPADRIKGFSKGMVGSLVVEPPGATWTTDAGTRASATVTYPEGSGTKTFREFVTVHQDDVNLRYGGGCSPTAANLQCAVGGVAGETQPGASEDNEDSGGKGLNYRTEPVWYRLGLEPGVPFTDPKLVDNPDIHRAFANELAGGDPQTPVFTANAGTPVRFRVVQPGGHTRGHVFGVNGHDWQRQPYTADSDRQTGSEPLPDPTRLCGSAGDPDCAGDSNTDGVTPTQNLISWWVGAQEGVSASSHFDVNIPQAGGPFGTTGDFLFRDSGSLGSYQGLWGLLRVR